MTDRIELPTRGSVLSFVSFFSRRFFCSALLVTWVLTTCTTTRAQDAPDTAVLDTIRVQAQITESDQRRIGDWIEAQVTRLKGTSEADRPQAAVRLRDLFRTQFDHASNTAAFKEQFAARTAAVLVSQLQGDADPVTARTLVKILLDFNRIEAMPAYLAGLKAKDSGVRMLSATGLASHRTAIAADKAKLDPTVAALREAGMAETEGVVLDRIYWALSVPPAQTSAVADAFMAIFEKRLAKKREGGVACDGAEVTAFEFFRTPGVATALSQSQKEQLVRVAGEFMRNDAKRYMTPNLNFNEIDRIQRQLDAAEDIIVAVAGAGLKGGDVRGALATGHPADKPPTAVLQQVYLWVGNPESKQAGALNAAPWNLPIESP